MLSGGEAGRIEFQHKWRFGVFADNLAIDNELNHAGRALLLKIDRDRRDLTQFAERCQIRRDAYNSGQRRDLERRFGSAGIAVFVGEAHLQGRRAGRIDKRIKCEIKLVCAGICRAAQFSPCGGFLIRRGCCAFFTACHSITSADERIIRVHGDTKGKGIGRAVSSWLGWLDADNRDWNRCAQCPLSNRTLAEGCIGLHRQRVLGAIQRDIDIQRDDVQAAEQGRQIGVDLDELFRCR